MHLKPATRPAQKNLYAASALFLCAVGFLIAPSLPPVMGEGNTVPVIAPGSAYRQTNFVSDIPGVAFVQDPLLVNPWGMAFRGTSPFWVSNAGTSTSTLYRGDVSGSPLVKNPGLSVVNVPGGLPTGIVGNSTTDFAVTPCSVGSCPTAFIWASKTGNIVGWNPSAPAVGSVTGIIAASHPGRVYTGLATGSNSGGNRLYAADFANGNIDVYDGTFALTTTSGGFADPTIPTTAGNTFHPFNIQAITVGTTTSLYVMYAKVGLDGLDEEGVGNGFVRRFNTDGVRDLTFGINNGPLNSPWGVAIATTVAPGDFGIFSGALLIGNFGEGNPSIHAFNPTTGAFLGTIQDESGNGIVIDELWALQFGNGVNGGDPNTLYFTAGTAEEEHGLFGSLKPTAATATSLIQFSADNYAIGEGNGSIEITVTRDGDASAAATVNYATYDQSQPDHASQKSDYEITLGKVTFAPGETSQTFTVLLVNDAFDENDEVINLILSNPTGAGTGLGSPNVAELTILDNDTGAPTSNPIDDSTFFVRQHYLDFLNREPDASGLSFWVNQIESCGADAACREVRRINVSAAFFLSIEFQDSGYAAYLTHRAAYSPTIAGGPSPVLYGQFMRDLQAINRGVIFGQPGAAALLEANKQAFYNDFITRPEFVTKYPGTLTNEEYVDNLLASAGLAPSNFVVNMTNSQENPPANPTTSGGARRPASHGTATFSINAAATAMTFSATINNIDFTGNSQTPADTNDNLTVAHIHAGAAVTPTTNGGVVWGFIGSPFNDDNPNDVVSAPFGSGVGFTISGKWDAPEGNNTTLAAQLSNLKEGRAYINFHTTQFGGGEIRGNFPEMTAFRDSLVAGLNGATETRATVLRKVSESTFLKQREFNSAFVTMQYFGYLRRDADTAGFNFWRTKLNDFNGHFVDSEMVKAFIISTEYRQRFGP